jgi:glycosyltransferase involved in cell wall biosynthesis
VVLPAYNEEAIIERTCATSATCWRIWRDYEIIVTNDGSKDQTGRSCNDCSRLIRS